MKQINELYTDIVKALSNSGNSLASKSKRSHRIIPGWNDCVKELHDFVRNAYLMWRDNGKPRHGHLSNQMRQTRAQFKYALRLCKKEQVTHRADSLAHKFENVDQREFWKHVKQHTTTTSNK